MTERGPRTEYKEMSEDGRKLSPHDQSYTMSDLQSRRNLPNCDNISAIGPNKFVMGS